MFLIKPITLFLIAITTGGLFQFYNGLGVFNNNSNSTNSSIHSPITHSHGNNCILTDQGNAIVWNADALLDWKDFKASDNTSQDEAVATSNTGFGYTLTKKKGSPEGDVFAHFYCQGSWKKPELKSHKVLSHEQGHFDICELYSRKFLEEIEVLKEQDKLTTRSLKVLYRKMNREFKDFQNQYDAETNHSTDRFHQRIWNAKISNELEDLKHFEANRTF